MCVLPTSFGCLLNPLTSRYCNRVFDPSLAQTTSIFLTLLRIYLQPGVSSTTKSPTTSTVALPPPATLLHPALQLISRHSRRLDATETLKLLPPLVQARDVKEFLVESLRAPIFDTRVIREIAKTRRDDVAARLMVLEERRVKVVDSRMCVFGSHPFIVSSNSPRPFFGPEGFCILFVGILFFLILALRFLLIIVFASPQLSAVPQTNRAQQRHRRSRSKVGHHCYIPPALLDRRCTVILKPLGSF